MSYNFWFWIFVAFNVSQPIVLFCARNWLKAYIEKGVEHKFGVRLEELRSELRNNEEEIKSDIRKREADINVLRERVFNARAGRQTLIDKRRIEATEKVWDAVVSLNAFRIYVTAMTIIDFETASKEAAKNPEFREFIGMISGGEHLKTENMKFANTEQLFIGEVAWSYYNTYYLIIAIAAMQVATLKSGLSDASKILKIKSVVDAVKKVMPEYQQYIGEHGLLACYHLCDELNGRILNALREELTGKVVETEDISRLAKINWELKKIEMQRDLTISGFQHLRQAET